MCGIAGELRIDVAPDRDALARMGTALAPRGPDGAGEWVEGSAGLTHRRLAIIDVTERGAQPMVDEYLGLPSSSTAASITTASCAPSSSATASPSSPAATRRCC